MSHPSLIPLVALASGLAGLGNDALAASTGHGHPPTQRSLEAIYHRGVELTRQDERLSALKLFESVIDAVDAKERSQHGIVARAAKSAGTVCLQLGQDREAERHLRLTSRLSPNDGAVQNRLALALLKQGKVNEAALALKAAVRTSPPSVEAMNTLARLLVSSGNLKLVAKYLVRSLQLRPKGNRAALVLLVKVYAIAGMPERRKRALAVLAQEAGSKAELVALLIQEGLYDCAEEAVNPASAGGAASTEMRVLSALLAAKRGKLDRAERTLRCLVAEVPGDPAMATHLAVVLLEQGRAAEAAELARQTAARFPSYAEARYALGLAKAELGETEEAQNCYERVLELRADHAQAWNNLGTLAAGRNRAGQALMCFARAVSAAPHWPEAQYNLGCALVITKSDYQTGVRLLSRVSAGHSRASKKARSFLLRLERLAAGQDAAALESEGSPAAKMGVVR